MRRAEGVININIRQLCQPLCDLRVVFLLALVKARVFQHQHLARFQLAGRFFCQRPDAVLHERNLLSQQLRQAHCRRAHRIFRFRSFFRPSQVRAQDDRRYVIQQILDGGQRGPDTGIVRYLSVLDRNVEIHPHQDALSPDIDIGDQFLIKHAFLQLMVYFK